MILIDGACKYIHKRSGVIAALLFGLALSIPVRAQENPVFVGGEVCASCHVGEAERWRTSHHAMAMQEAQSATVLGNFDNAIFTHHGSTTTFFRDGDKFMLRTEGPDNSPNSYQVTYTFGVYPLQQYLIAFPGGRYQALGIAWDSRPADQGGQRWFHLYPGEVFRPGDLLHWTGRDQTWNYQCAACHSTYVQKNYDVNTDTYATSWSDVNVACEACHGPGSRHVAWAQAHVPGEQETDRGLTTRLEPADPKRWRMNFETGIATRVEPPVGQEFDSCAPCHSRRKPIAESSQGAPAPFIDTYLPALLEPGLYHADGQIDGEVFEYGSFIQSRMYHAGVRCSNCHEPHGLTLRAQGNTLCTQCHLPSKFDTTTHHKHTTDSPGAKCVNCHMPSKIYMVVDDRRDHSFRIPRPDLSIAIGTPNACTQCHADRSAEWAAGTIEAWFPGGRQSRSHYGVALDAGRRGSIEAERLLGGLLRDADAPAIARATALTLLPPLATLLSEPAVIAAFTDPSPLVRAAALRSVQAPTSPEIVKSALTLLSDPIRLVRIEAARAFAGIDQRTLTDAQQTDMVLASLELVAAELVDADRPESHLNLGLFDSRNGRLTEAEERYRTALRLDPKFVPALANLADLDRRRGREAEGEDYLRKALAIEPENPDIHHSLGLLMVRAKNYAEAMVELRKAQDLAPDNARYAYVYAIALNGMGARPAALDLLKRTHARHPADREVLAALISLARESGDLTSALSYAKSMAALDPANEQLRLLIRDLEKSQRR